MSFIKWTVIFFFIIVVVVYKNGQCLIKEDVNLKKLLKDWQNISMTWCQWLNFPDETIDAIYECFRVSRGNKEFELQIFCENKIFPDSMSKNEIRKAMCKNDPLIVKTFEECYAKAGFVVKNPSPVDSQPDFDKQEKIKKNYKNFQQLMTCIKTAFGWILN